MFILITQKHLNTKSKNWLTWKEALGDGRRRARWDGSGSARGWRRKSEEENSKDKIPSVESFICYKKLKVVKWQL